MSRGMKVKLMTCKIQKQKMNEKDGNKKLLLNAKFQQLFKINIF
jgi:hypothetical protein